MAVDSIRCLGWTEVQTEVKTDAALNRDCLARGMFQLNVVRIFLRGSGDGQAKLRSHKTRSCSPDNLGFSQA